MNIDDAFPSPYIAAGDLPTDGLPVTFDSVRMEFFQEDNKHKAIVFFREFNKGMMLNKTNKNSIVDLLGSKETNTWIGQRITIYPTECDFKGDRVACIRVKLRAPEKSANGAGDGWVAAMLRSFSELNVTRQMIEARLGHSVAELQPNEREQLKEIHKSMATLGARWPEPEPVDLWMGGQVNGGELVINKGW